MQALDVFLDMKFHDIPNTCAESSSCCRAMGSVDDQYPLFGAE